MKQVESRIPGIVNLGGRRDYFAVVIADNRIVRGSSLVVVHRDNLHQTVLSIYRYCLGSLNLFHLRDEEVPLRSWVTDVGSNDFGVNGLKGSCIVSSFPLSFRQIIGDD